MFGLSFTELAIIAILALLLLGADRLPDAARTVGKGLRELRRATEDLKDQIETEVYADERRRRQLPVAPVQDVNEKWNKPAGDRAQEPAAPPGPESVPGYLPGFEPPAGPAPGEPRSVAPAPAPDAGDPPRT